MPHIEIYLKNWCSYSHHALALLDGKGVAYTAIDLTNDRGGKEQEMRQRSGRTSVPQVFIGGQHIGGFNDLAAVDAAGELDVLLNGAPSHDFSNAA